MPATVDDVVLVPPCHPTCVEPLTSATVPDGSTVTTVSKAVVDAGPSTRWTPVTSSIRSLSSTSAGR